MNSLSVKNLFNFEKNSCHNRVQWPTRKCFFKTFLDQNAIVIGLDLKKNKIKNEKFFFFIN